MLLITIRYLFLSALIAATAALAQSDDIDAAMKKALENPNAPAKGADMKKLQHQAQAQIDAAEAENKAEDGEKKAAVEAAVNVKGPAALPAWTPDVPQFTPAGAATRKVIDGEPKIVVTGTSQLSPEALCDAWDKFANPKFSHERGGSEINHNLDLYVSYRNNEDNKTVRLEAERKVGEKVTRVTVSSPLPIPAP